jgi:hypothetical protein
MLKEGGRRKRSCLLEPGGRETHCTLFQPSGLRSPAARWCKAIFSGRSPSPWSGVAVPINQVTSLKWADEQVPEKLGSALRCQLLLISVFVGLHA